MGKGKIERALEDILDEIIRKYKVEFTAYVQTRVQEEYVAEVQMLMDKKCTEIINEFYASYEPSKYIRTGNIRNALWFEVTPDLHGYAHASTELMSNSYKADLPWVFEQTIEYGFHGRKNVGDVFNPSPKQRLYDYFDEILANKQTICNGIVRRNMERYAREFSK